MSKRRTKEQKAARAKMKHEMAKKRKLGEARRQERIRKETEEKLALIGLEDTDEFYDMIYTEAEIVEEKDLGFYDEKTAYDDYCNPFGEDLGISYACISEYNGKYIVWTRIGHEFGDDTRFEDASIFDNFEDAKAEFDKIPYMCRPIREMIEELKEEVGDPEVWIDVKPDLYGYRLNLKYKQKLLLEKYLRLDAEMIRNAISSYQAFEKELSESDISIFSIHKEPREWNNNQRYYIFEFFGARQKWKERIHIPSVMQGKPRDVISFFDQKKKDELKEKVAEVIEENREAWEENDVLKRAENEAKKEYKETHDISVPPFPWKTAKKMYAYIHKKLGPSFECDGTIQYTKQWLENNIPDPDHRYYTEIFLEEHGGFCDCEILMNTQEKEYWDTFSEKNLHFEKTGA